MKNIKTALIGISTVCFLNACSGNHAANNEGKDSVKSDSAVSTPNSDTARKMSTTGDTSATSVDHSGSGGTDIKKDTAKKKM